MPPIWLRKLRQVAEEQRHEIAAPASSTERFRVASALTAFALARLTEQAARRGCSVGEMLVFYERAGARLRSRA